MLIAVAAGGATYGLLGFTIRDKRVKFGLSVLVAVILLAVLSLRPGANQFAGSWSEKIE